MSKAPRHDPPADDPRPTPPVQPELDDCCRSGCSPCVFDLYDEALARYEAALAAWETRHVSRKARQWHAVDARSPTMHSEEMLHPITVER